MIGGPLVRAALAKGGELIPVDSEHSASLQCLGGRPAAEVSRLVLTASGGPLRSHADWREATRGEIRTEDVWERFVAKVLSFVDVSTLRNHLQRGLRKLRSAAR